MKLRKTQIILLAAILCLPLILFNSCETSEEIIFEQEKLFTKDSKIVPLFLKAVGATVDSSFKKSFGDEDQCTEFVYPMTFYAYSSDAEEPSPVVINNDEELVAFLTSLTSGQEFFITYPVTLIDVDGNQTVISDYPDLEGVLTMLIDACLGDDDDDDDDENDDNDDDLGIRNAHFDVDTATEVYNFYEGETDAHTHEYDEKYDTNIVDYFNIETGGKTGNSALHNITDLVYGVPNNDELFYIIVGNAQLSQDVQLEINGTKMPVLDYQAKVDAYVNGDTNALEVYTLGSSQTAITLTSLKFIVGMDAATVDNGLIPTETKTVRSNTPGPNGEYRDGALIAQAIDADSMLLNADLGVAASDSRLFWESTIFWHNKDGDNENNGDNEDACECKGEVDALDLQYLGDRTDASIVVYEGKIDAKKVMTTFENINKNDVISFIGNKKENKMGSKIIVVVDGDIANATEIHTSCSQDILIGMTFGNFEIEGGSSSKGGEFCDPGDDAKYEYCHKKNKKIVICHKGKSICISINAIWGHMANHSEDYFGSCNN